MYLFWIGRGGGGGGEFIRWGRLYKGGVHKKIQNFWGAFIRRRRLYKEARLFDALRYTKIRRVCN